MFDCHVSLNLQHPDVLNLCMSKVRHKLNLQHDAGHDKAKQNISAGIAQSTQAINVFQYKSIELSGGQLR